MSKTKQRAKERLADPVRMEADHKQFEAWLRGEVNEPPECMKIKDSDKIQEITDSVPDNHPFKDLCGAALDQYIKKVRKKHKSVT